MASTVSRSVRPAARLRWLLISWWQPVWEYFLYPAIQWLVIWAFMLYLVIKLRIFNRMKIRGTEQLRLRDKGDLIVSWHESMGDSFVIGAAIGLDLAIHQRRVPWNFAAAENFMQRPIVAGLVRMLKTHPVNRTEGGRRADVGALLHITRLLRESNVVLFAAGTRFTPDQETLPRAGAGIGLSAAKAQRVILMALAGVGGQDGVLPYFKHWTDVPVRWWHQLLGPFRNVPRYYTWTFGFKNGKHQHVNWESITVDELNERFPLNMENRGQHIADFIMNRIIELRQQII